MTVAELIKELKRFPDDMEVGLTEWDEPISACFEVKNLELNETFGLCIINFWLEGEERVLNKGVEVWLARDGGVIGSLHLFRNPPSRNPTSRVFTIHNFNIPLKLPNYLFPEVTFENSPKKARIILED
jgi:hypothetical protein